MIDHDKRLLQIHIPKTGGTSIKRVLAPQAGTTHRVAADYDVVIWESYFTFAFIRNPFDRTVSHYCYHCRGKYRGKLLERHPDMRSLSFREYLTRFVVPKSPVNFVSQQTYLTHPQSDKGVSFLGRYESLEEDFARLLDALGRAPEPLPHVLASRHDHYSTYYDDETRALVEQAYADDLSVFGYTFERA